MGVEDFGMRVQGWEFGTGVWGRSLGQEFGDGSQLGYSLSNI